MDIDITKFNPNDFNPIIYKSLYPDLSNLTDDELLDHYINYGFNENRIYKITLPNDFNTSNYKSLNIDLSHLNDNELKIHYYLYGSNENRPYLQYSNIEQNELMKDFIIQNTDKNKEEQNELMKDFIIQNTDKNKEEQNTIQNNFKEVIDNKYTKYNTEQNQFINLKKQYATVYFMGGIGNILYELSAIYSYCIDYNIKFYIDNIQTDERKYNIFNISNNINKLSNVNHEYIDIKIENTEKEYKYNKLDKINEYNIIFKGYFQSYKYFWHNRDDICQLFDFSNKLIYWHKYLKRRYGKTIAIHIRLTDYITSNDTHFTLPITYYHKIISQYDLTQYKIILFSDNTEEALKLLNLDNISCADNIIKDDLEQLFILSVTDIRICANSTYSLWSCYINDLYNINDNAIYYIPDIWFSYNGPLYDIYDLIPKNNNKYKLTNVYKSAVIFFHKNIYKLYNKYWITKCIDSIISQTYNNSDIFEINYGNDEISIFDDYNLDDKYNHYFYSKDYETHTEAMVFLLKECFENNNYDLVFNTNLDDYYSNKRFIYQIHYINEGSLLNSSLWTYITQKDETTNIDILKPDGYNRIIYEIDDFKWMISKSFNDYIYKTSKEDYIKYDVIKTNIFNKNNIINHSGICFTRKFWNTKNKYGYHIKYRNDKPYEDLSYWYRALENNVNISIINNNLIYYRIHNLQIGEQDKNIKLKGITEKTFKKEPNLIDILYGILLKIDYENINLIDNIYNYILPDKNKILFIYTENNNLNNIKEYLSNTNYNYYIKTFNKLFNDEIDIEYSLNLFNIQLEINTDHLFIVKDFKNKIIYEDTTHNLLLKYKI